MPWWVGLGRGRWGVGLVESEGCSWHGDVLGIVVVCGIEKADWFFDLMVGEDGNVLVGKVVATVMQIGFLSATFFLADSCDKLLLGARQAMRPREQNHFTCRSLYNTATKLNPWKGYLFTPSSVYKPLVGNYMGISSFH
jgi:hypothetical protein